MSRVSTFDTHFVYHAAIVQHVRIEESVPQADVTVHLPPPRRHPREHRADQRVPETKRRRRELVEDRGVARGVVFAVVALFCVVNTELARQQTLSYFSTVSVKEPMARCAAN